MYVCAFSGNAGPYCRHIFHKIDDDNSGTISFKEYMSAISLSLLADIKQQLKFVCTCNLFFFEIELFFKVFKLCTHGNSKDVHTDELINFIELITELEGGEDAVDPVAAEIIVHQIMESNNNGINENEFLDKWSVYF